MALVVVVRGKGGTEAQGRTEDRKPRCTRFCENCIENGDTPPAPCGFPGDGPHAAHQCIECAWKQHMRDQPQPEPETEVQEATGAEERCNEETVPETPAEEMLPRNPDERTEKKPSEEEATHEPEAEERSEPTEGPPASAPNETVQEAAEREVEQIARPRRAEDTRTGRRGMADREKAWRW